MKYIVLVAGNKAFESIDGDRAHEMAQRIANRFGNVTLVFPSGHKVNVCKCEAAA